jgi:hypothetical protein
MSYYLIDFTTKSNDFNFDNLIIGRRIKNDQDNSKYYMYYQTDQSDTPKEIYIRLPILRLIYNLANYKYNQLNIPIYPNWELTNKFVDFIQKLENDILECFNNKKNKREFVSLISKKNILNFIKANINDNVKLSSNLENKNITLFDFKINGQIDVVIKMSYIWSKGNKMGLSSQIYQIKYLAPPEQLNINFIDPEISPPPPPPPPKFIEKAQINSEEIICEQQIPTRMPPQIKLKIIPSIKDLQKAIKGLKHVNIKED